MIQFSLSLSFTLQIEGKKASSDTAGRMKMIHYKDSEYLPPNHFDVPIMHAFTALLLPRFGRWLLVTL